MLGCMLRQQCWRIQNELQAVVHVGFLHHVPRRAWLELTGCGVVLRPVALGALEVERDVHLHGVSNRRGARPLDACLLLEDPLGLLHLAVMWGVDPSSEEAGRLVRLRLPFKNQSARLDSNNIRLQLCVSVLSNLRVAWSGKRSGKFWLAAWQIRVGIFFPVSNACAGSRFDTGKKHL